MTRALLALVVLLWSVAAGRDALDRWIEATPLPVLVQDTGAEMRDRNGALLRAYTVGDGTWRLAESDSGHRSSSYDDLGLRFLGANEPAHHQLMFHRTEGDLQVRPSLLQLHEKQWVAHPAQNLLRRSRSLLAGRPADPWLIAQRRDDDKNEIIGYHLAGPQAGDEFPSYRLMTPGGSFKTYIGPMATSATSPPMPWGTCFRSSSTPKH